MRYVKQAWKDLDPKIKAEYKDLSNFDRKRFDHQKKEMSKDLKNTQNRRSTKKIEVKNEQGLELLQEILIDSKENSMQEAF